MARDLRTRLWQSLREIDGVDEGSSVFAEDDARALWVDATQVAHFVAADALEVRLTKRTRRDGGGCAQAACGPPVATAAVWRRARAPAAVSLATLQL